MTDDELDTHVNSSGVSRRKLLSGGVGLAVAGTMATLPTGAHGVPAATTGVEAGVAAAPAFLLPPERIGLQLYSVRDEITSLGFARVLQTLAGIGYKKIEFAGYGQGTTPEIPVKQLRAILDANGLTAIGSHVSPTDDASMQQILDDAETLGVPQVGISLVLPDSGPTVSGWQQLAKRYNHFGALAAKRGIGFYLHNHFEEWLPTADDPKRRGEDILLAETDPALVSFELDIYWAYVGRSQSGDSFDPLVDYAIAHRDRYGLFHIKDGRPDAGGTYANPIDDMVDVGQGVIDFQRFLTEVFKQAPGEIDRHSYIWERDNASKHPRGALAAARASFVHMRYALLATAPSASPAPTPPAGSVDAVITKTAFRRTKAGRRVLRVTLAAAEPVDVSVKLSRGSTTLARRPLTALLKGTRTLDLPLPLTSAAGPARLVMSITDRNGTIKTVHRPLTVPARTVRRVRRTR